MKKQIKKDLTKIKKTKNVSMMSISQNRGGVFLPVSKAIHLASLRKYVFQNKWQEVTIEGRPLTATHQDIIEAIFFCAEDIKEFQGGKLAVKFAPGKVLKLLGAGENYTWLYEKIKDLALNIITIKKIGDKDQMPPIKHIIDDFDKTDESMNKKLPNGEYAKYRYIVFSETFMSFLRNDVLLFYKDKIPSILSLKNPILKSIARFCLSHKETNMSLDEVLDSLKVSAGKRYRRKIKKEIVENANSLLSFGIKLLKIRTGDNAGKIGIFYNKKDILLQHNNQ